MRFLILIAPLLAGCASEVWVKPGGSVEDLNRDVASCRAKHRDELQKHEELHAACMRALGYTRQRRYVAWQ